MRSAGAWSPVRGRRCARCRASVRVSLWSEALPPRVVRGQRPQQTRELAGATQTPEIGARVAHHAQATRGRLKPWQAVADVAWEGLCHLGAASRAVGSTAWGTDRWARRGGSNGAFLQERGLRPQGAPGQVGEVGAQPLKPGPAHHSPSCPKTSPDGAPGASPWMEARPRTDDPGALWVGRRAGCRGPWMGVPGPGPGWPGLAWGRGVNEEN